MDDRHHRMTGAMTRLTLLAFALAAFSAAGQRALAQEAPATDARAQELSDAPPPQRVFPAAPDSAYVARLKRDAERVYERGNYDRAYRLYRYGLAWRGDKYAQYMVGYMLFNGQGVRANRVLGTAWLQLAAQRGDEARLNGVYDDALARLSDADQARVADIHSSLLADYGDRKVLRRLIRADRRELRNVTGTRTGASDMLPLTIQLPNGQTVPGSIYYGAIKERLAQRIDYLEGKVTLGSFQVLDEAPVDEEPDAVPADAAEDDDATTAPEE